MATENHSKLQNNVRISFSFFVKTGSDEADIMSRALAQPNRQSQQSIRTRFQNSLPGPNPGNYYLFWPNVTALLSPYGMRRQSIVCLSVL